MTTLTLTGRYDSALTHMALLGIAAILQDAGVTGVRTWFTDVPSPQPAARAECTDDQIAAVLHQHAVRAASPDSWVAARVDVQGAGNRATMSPRLGTPAGAAGWAALQAARHTQLDTLTAINRFGDLDMIAGLGEPAYWRCNERDSRPDEGASRWEMKTRNRGEEFVGDRLHKLAHVVAERTVDGVLAGLTGARLRDELGKDAATSRTATGFARPGPVDSAVAWCALWGLGSFPVVARAAGHSQTPGAYPRDRITPARMALPIVTVPTALSRLRAIIRSSALDAYATGELDTADLTGPRRWLRDHDVAAVIRFPVQVVGSTSAPERQLLDGTLIPLG